MLGAKLDFFSSMVLSQLINSTEAAEHKFNSSVVNHNATIAMQYRNCNLLASITYVATAEQYSD